MPTYQFKNKINGKISSIFMSISECEKYAKKNPGMVQQVTAPAIIDPFHRKQIPSGFREVLSKIKKRNHKSTINTGNLTAL